MHRLVAFMPNLCGGRAERELEGSFAAVRAVLVAVRQTDLDESIFPEVRPCGFAVIMNKVPSEVSQIGLATASPVGNRDSLACTACRSRAVQGPLALIQPAVPVRLFSILGE